MGFFHKFDDKAVLVREQALDIISMDKDIEDKFDAIVVMVKMLGEPQPDGNMYTIDALPINREEIEFAHFINLWGGVRLITKTSPVFVWMVKIHGNFIHLFIECGLDHKVRYPVECYIVTPKEFNQASVSYQKLDRADLIRFLDNLLHNM